MHTILAYRENERSLSDSHVMNDTFRKLEKIRQNEILDAAAEVFADHGYHGASIPAICSKAGISVGALYKYFNNKEALYIAILQRMADLLISEFYGRIQIHQESLLDTIQQILTNMTETPLFFQYKQYVILYIDVGSYSMNGFAESITDRFENIGREFYTDLVEHFKKSRQVRTEIKTDHAAYFIDSYVTLYAYTLVSAHHRLRFDRFFTNGDESISHVQRISIILDSIKMLL